MEGNNGGVPASMARKWFRCIASMDMRRDELKFALVGSLECQAGFIVHDVSCWRCPDRLEEGKHVMVCRYTMTVVFGSEGSDKDGI